MCSLFHPLRNTHFETKVAKFTTQWFFCLSSTCNGIYYFKEALKSDWFLFVLVLLSHWLRKRYDLEQKIDFWTIRTTEPSQSDCKHHEWFLKRCTIEGYSSWFVQKKCIFLWSLLLACRNARGRHGGEILVEGKLTSLVSDQRLLFLLRSFFLGKH